MKNILFITGSDKLTGPNKQLINLIESLTINSNLNINLYICKIIKDKNKSIINKLEKIKNLNLIIVNKKITRNFSFKIFYNLRDIIKLIKLNNYEIIQTSGFIPDIYIFTLKKFLFKNFCWITYIRSQVKIEYKIRYQYIYIWKLISFIHQFIINSSDKIIFVSKSVRNHMCNINKKNFVLNNSLIIEDEKIINKLFINKKKNNFKKNSKLNIYNFIYVGHFDLLKNPQFLVDFWMYKSISNSKLNLYGTWNSSKYLKKIFKTSKNSSNIAIYNFNKRILHQYLNSDIYISASKTEGFPNTIIEALCSGCLCILSNIPPHNEIKEIFPNYIFLYDLNSFNSLENTIKNLFKKFKEIPKLKIAKESILYFSSKSLSQKYLKIINE